MKLSITSEQLGQLIAKSGEGYPLGDVMKDAKEMTHNNRAVRGEHKRSVMPVPYDEDSFGFSDYAESVGDAFNIRTRKPTPASRRRLYRVIFDMIDNGKGRCWPSGKSWFFSTEFETVKRIPDDPRTEIITFDDDGNEVSEGWVLL